MVPDTGKTLRANTYRTVNLPDPVEVKEALSGLPLAVKTPRWQTVVAIEERWRIDDEWWREKISRQYFQIELQSGMVLTIFRDLVSDKWYQQKY